MGRRNLTKQILDNVIELGEGDLVGRVIEPRGKNLHLIEYVEDFQNENSFVEETPKIVSTLCLLPPKFRNLVWVRRGGYVVLKLYTEKDGKRTSDTKIGGFIEHVLFPYHIKQLKAENKWPSAFSEEIKESETESDEEIINPNHRGGLSEDSSSEEE